MYNDTPETIVWAIRHGQTEWNAQGRLQGQLPVTLDEQGRDQARALRPALEALDWDLAISSDLVRVVETAQLALGDRAEGLLLDERLRERHLGVLQGHLYTEARQTMPEVIKIFSGGPPQAPIPEGESLVEFHERCVGALEALRQTHKGRKVLVFTHGGVLREWFKHIVGAPIDAPRRFSTANTSINELHVRKWGWFIQSWGDTAHMAKTGFLPH